MPAYKIRFTVDADNEERKALLELDHPASELDLVQSAAMIYRPEERQEIGNIVDSIVSDPSELPPHLDLMAQLGILELTYTVDGDQTPFRV